MRSWSLVVALRRDAHGARREVRAEAAKRRHGGYSGALVGPAVRATRSTLPGKTHAGRDPGDRPALKYGALGSQCCVDHGGSIPAIVKRDRLAWDRGYHRGPRRDDSFGRKLRGVPPDPLRVGFGVH